MTDPAAPSAPRTARAIARQELTRAILTAASAQLAAHGPAHLSVRAVARELGMASSAVYRYFPSRDDLLTALLVQAYNDLGLAAETADAAAEPTAYAERWLILGRTVRRWALEQPHAYALLFGSPVPGYAAPRTTVEPALRVTGVLAGILRDAAADRADTPVETAPVESAPVETAPATSTSTSFDPALRAFFGAGVDERLLYAGLAAWSGLIGALTLELFGHLVGAVSDFDTYTESLLRRLSPVRP